MTKSNYVRINNKVRNFIKWTDLNYTNKDLNVTGEKYDLNTPKNKVGQNKILKFNMKKVIKLLVVLIVVLSFSSCGIHSGYMDGSTSLSQSNFSYTQKSISGTSSTLMVFGIGGLGKGAIVEEAKKDMLKKHPLKSNQSLANITVNWKSSFYFIVMTNKCTVTADIVEFN